MMRFLISFFTLASAVTWLAANPASEWQVRASIPRHVYGHSGAVAGNKLYAIGGCNTPDWQKPCPFNQVYDPTSDSWSSGADLPLALAWAMPAVHKEKIYVFGGGYYDPGNKGITSSSKAWKFDPASNSWTSVRDLPVPIMNGFATTVDDSIYVGLGYNRQGGEGADIAEHYHNTYRYDPENDTYTRVADSPEYGCYAAAGEWQGALYVVHGAETEIGFHKMSEYVWADGALKYNPAADRWTKIQTPRVKKRVFYLTQSTSSAVFGARLFAIGGMGEWRDRTTVASYFDMEQEIFHEIPSILEPRCCGGGGVAGSELILTGGFYGVAEDLGDVCAPTWVLDLRGLSTIKDRNLARHKPALAGSESEGRQAVRANDGNLDTFWAPASTSGQDQWWQVDLQNPQPLAACRITWGSGTIERDFTIETSTDGHNWTAAARDGVQRPTPRLHVADLAGRTARFLRIRLTDERKEHPRLLEVEVYGSD
jgi:N-acetylneuraminic acid mutarotase